jgi:CheY-like chemotaxis protein
MMPVMDGWQFRQEQTSDSRLAAIPVIVVSALHEARQSIMASGAANFLGKPVHVDALIDAFRDQERTGLPAPIGP